MVIKRDFIYTPKGKNRPLHIYLPDDYEETDERYPVTYFFDGHNLFFDEDATYGKSWGLKDFMDGWDKKMIIVGIECGHEGNERLSEYLPFRVTWGEFSHYKPLGDKTMQWIVNEIKPYIDEHFRTMPLRECTGIAGSSMGGLMSIYGLSHYNRWFSKGGCVSPCMGYCIRSVMKDLRAHPLDPDSRMYISWGTREANGIKDPNRLDRSSKTYSHNKRVANQALSDGAAVDLYCQVGGAHCEADWEKQIPAFMDFLWME